PVEHGYGQCWLKDRWPHLGGVGGLLVSQLERILNRLGDSWSRGRMLEFTANVETQKARGTACRKSSQAVDSLLIPAAKVVYHRLSEVIAIGQRFAGNPCNPSVHGIERDILAVRPFQLRGKLARQRGVQPRSLVRIGQGFVN